MIPTNYTVNTVYDGICFLLTLQLLLQEDEMLRRLVAQYGTKKWAHLATIIKTKKSKQVAHIDLFRQNVLLQLDD